MLRTPKFRDLPLCFIYSLLSFLIYPTFNETTYGWCFNFMREIYLAQSKWRTAYLLIHKKKMCILFIFAIINYPINKLSSKISVKSNLPKRKKRN